MKNCCISALTDAFGVTITSHHLKQVEASVEAFHEKVRAEREMKEAAKVVKFIGRTNTGWQVSDWLKVA